MRLLVPFVLLTALLCAIAAHSRDRRDDASSRGTFVADVADHSEDAVGGLVLDLVTVIVVEPAVQAAPLFDRIPPPCRERSVRPSLGRAPPLS